MTKIFIILRDLLYKVRLLFSNRRGRLIGLLFANFVYVFLFAGFFQGAKNFLSPLPQLTPLEESKRDHEVFGFAPHWTFHRLDNVDFGVLTTMAYFGLEVAGNGDLETSGPGYDTFHSERATDIFRKAHAHGTRVVLTLTQMNNNSIIKLLDSPEAQQKTIEQAVTAVKDRGIDGINVDFEYVGTPPAGYKDKFSVFVAKLTQRMHEEIPQSQVTVSVYAASAKTPKMYDIGALSQNADGIFMMAYDFAVARSENAMPTAPLYGHEDGTYWYDIATAVDDFLAVMPANKLILGVPWYGYNYAVSEPGVKARTNTGYYTWQKRGKRTVRVFVPNKGKAQTYTLASDITSTTEGVREYKEGWDDKGQVGYKAYKMGNDSSWRIIFLEDTRSLSIKYDFAKEKNLLGVGMWALGFDSGKNEFWDLLRDKFGIKIANKDIVQKAIL